MERKLGTVAMGVRTGIIQAGDDLAEIVVDSLIDAVEANKLILNKNDVLGITESILARAEGNYASIEQIGEDVRNKFEGPIGLLFPIFSRNRFAVILKGIIKSGRKVYLQLSYPTDEVGNRLVDDELLIEKNLNPYTDSFDEAKFREYFGENVAHRFTGVDYVKLYKEIGGDQIEILFSNDPKYILKYTKDVLVANVHARKRTKENLKKAGANVVLGLEDILNKPVDGSGYNPEYGLLGSNLATKDSLKLFPRDSQIFVEDVQKKIKEKTGVEIHVMVYGDGAFKDPAGQIWELADPVVSPGFTKGLEGTPNELKLKYIADNELRGLSKEEATNKMKEKISHKEGNITKTDSSLGTTPRQLTDLLGSLCDLISGSGDKGTPIILIQGYFDNFSTQ
ncbi:MAG: F420-0--gamma-glutamyl ligase [Tissierellia bacterium]|nr:F420-0--gamma-glutamyl ligase [Tissierellia bacterium]